MVREGGRGAPSDNENVITRVRVGGGQIGFLKFFFLLNKVG